MAAAVGLRNQSQTSVMPQLGTSAQAQVGRGLPLEKSELAEVIRRPGGLKYAMLLRALHDHVAHVRSQSLDGLAENGKEMPSFSLLSQVV